MPDGIPPFAEAPALSRGPAADQNVMHPYSATGAVLRSLGARAHIDGLPALGFFCLCPTEETPGGRLSRTLAQCMSRMHERLLKGGWRNAVQVRRRNIESAIQF